MSDDLVNRLRAARPTILALSRADTFLLKAYLDRYPAPQPWYEMDYDAQRRIGSMSECTDPDDEALWIHLYATLAYSQTELERLASAEPQPELTPADATGVQSEPLTQQEAAVLKVLGKHYSCRLTVAQIAKEMSLSDESIGDYLRKLERRKPPLVTTPAGKSGRTLTDDGKRVVDNLSDVAGATHLCKPG